MKKEQGYQLNSSNLTDYLYQTYREIKGAKATYSINPKMKPLLQDNYAGRNDCTITSLTALGLYHELHENAALLHKDVSEVAKKYFYDPNKMGTLPFFIKNIFDKFLGDRKSHSRYLKGIGFNWNTIKNEINKNNPIILSMLNDGRGYYKSHSVVIVGYKEYNSTQMLMIYDNWHLNISYIDYKKLNCISCINYL